MPRTVVLRGPSPLVVLLGFLDDALSSWQLLSHPEFRKG
jgi:hypothetical protein